MLFKVVRENEITYYNASHIRKMAVSPVYGEDDLYDLAFYIGDSMEIVKVCKSEEEAEEIILKLYRMIDNEKDDNNIVDLSTI